MPSLQPADILFHASMLRDAVRTSAFREAIRGVVRPGDVVCEIGAGTGILALFALAAGASKVYAIELGPVADAARAVVAGNGAEREVEIIHAPSTDVTLPQLADVLVTETVWNLGVGEGIIATVLDARRRLLKPGATVVPGGLEMLVAPVESDPAYSVVDVWDEDLFGFDFSSMRTLAANKVHASRLRERDLLAEPQQIAEITVDHEAPAMRRRLSFRAARGGQVHGLGGFFRALLTADISLSNLPPHDARSWAHAFLPLERPIDVREGESIDVDIWAAPAAEQWLWSVTAGEQQRRQSTLACEVLTPQRLRDLQPTAQPCASAEGRAVAQLIRALDGSHSIEAVVDGIVASHPELFQTRAAAERLVREAVERWT